MQVAKVENVEQVVAPPPRPIPPLRSSPTTASDLTSGIALALSHLDHQHVVGYVDACRIEETTSVMNDDVEDLHPEANMYEIERI